MNVVLFSFVRGLATSLEAEAEAERDTGVTGVERLGEGLWDYLLQATHPGTIRLEGDTAAGRAYVLSFGHLRDGGSHLNYSVYHDRYRRTPDGWRFAERADEIKYLDTTPLAGSPPPAAGSADD